MYINSRMKHFGLLSYLKRLFIFFPFCVRGCVQWLICALSVRLSSQAEVSSFFETNTSQYLALVFEKPDSYLGRELTLDLLQFENISVRRVLSTEQGLVAELGVTQFPSCYLYHPGGNFTRLEVKAEARTFYFYALQRLPGVVRSGKPPVVIDVHNNKTQEPWRPFNSSRVYMADLESTLHYSLRVELAAHTVIKGRALNPLKNYIGVLAKYFPGRPIVMNTLNSLNSWLQNQSQDEILYKDFKEILDNTAQSPDTALPRGERWVACQGSQLHFRRYPCGMWTLFHVLTVEAKKAEASNQLEVPLAMRNYIHAFFGCRYCAEHFDNLVRGSLLENEAVLWLWSIHNEVNSRLSGALSEDPNFPKIQWPSPDMCPECHNVTKRGEHRWNKDKALRFLLSYFSSNRILPDYLEDETQILAKQREEHASRLLALEAEKKAERRVREAPDLEIQPLPSNPTVQEEEEEEEEEEGEEPQDEAVAEGEEEEGGEGAVAAQESNPWDKPEMAGGERSQKVRRKPSIVGMKIRRNMEDHIVDLDLFENQHFKAKALQLAASSRIKRRSLQRKVEPEPGPVFGLGMELDGGVGMVGLQPVDADFDMDVGQQRKWLQKRDLSPTGHWMSTLSIGFSRVDVSLCVLLYFLSCMCLLGMYTFFQHRFRLRRVKFSMS
uniref:Sulfhydryl oxidase n=1 Tax=Cynoglossus semilaevis TaxID=244447 RepID=A0A3P8W2G1_CYNSE